MNGLLADVNKPLHGPELIYQTWCLNMMCFIAILMYDFISNVCVSYFRLTSHQGGGKECLRPLLVEIGHFIKKKYSSLVGCQTFFYQKHQLFSFAKLNVSSFYLKPPVCFSFFVTSAVNTNARFVLILWKTYKSHSNGKGDTNQNFKSYLIYYTLW